VKKKAIARHCRPSIADTTKQAPISTRRVHHALSGLRD
jgi:hypothetical protein